MLLKNTLNVFIVSFCLKSGILGAKPRILVPQKIDR